jgi:hypothetical protein
MKCLRLNRLSLAERAKLRWQLKDVVEAGLIRPSHSELGSPILVVRKVDGSLRLSLDYRRLNEVTRKDANPFMRVDDIIDEPQDANFYTHLDLAFGFKQVRVREEDVDTTAIQTHDGLMEWVILALASRCLVLMYKVAIFHPST